MAAINVQLHCWQLQCQIRGQEKYAPPPWLIRKSYEVATYWHGEKIEPWPLLGLYQTHIKINNEKLHWQGHPQVRPHQNPQGTNSHQKIINQSHAGPSLRSHPKKTQAQKRMDISSNKYMVSLATSCIMQELFTINFLLHSVQLVSIKRLPLKKWKMELTASVAW